MQLITTPRLLLRPLTPEVFANVFTNMSKREQMEFFGCSTEAEWMETRKKFEEGLSMYRKSFLIFQLLEKESSAVIGWCGYHTWYLKHRRAEIGYVMSDEKSKGKGLMKEALGFVLDYGFTTMNLNRVEAFVAPDNEVSLKLLRAFNFTQEGLMRKHYFYNDQFDDSLVFSLLQEEYEGGKELRK